MDKTILPSDYRILPDEHLGWKLVDRNNKLIRREVIKELLRIHALDLSRKGKYIIDIYDDNGNLEERIDFEALRAGQRK